MSNQKARGGWGLLSERGSKVLHQSSVVILETAVILQMCILLTSSQMMVALIYGPGLRTVDQGSFSRAGLHYKKQLPNSGAA